MNLVSLRNVVMRFDGLTAVNNLSFDIHGGEVVGILGSNGAGKSTIMKAIAGVLKPTSGEIVVNGLSTAIPKNSERIKEFTGYCPDVGGLIVGATPREHIQLLLNLHRRPELYERAIEGVNKIGLSEFIDTPVGGFSKGMNRRLSALLAALGARNVLILDEPFDGIDPIGVEAVKRIIQEAKRYGLAVIVSAHLQELLVDSSDRIIVMKRGRLLTTEPAENFAGPEGIERYRNLLENSK